MVEQIVNTTFYSCLPSLVFVLLMLKMHLSSIVNIVCLLKKKRKKKAILNHIMQKSAAALLLILGKTTKIIPQSVSDVQACVFDGKN